MLDFQTDRIIIPNEVVEELVVDYEKLVVNVLNSDMSNISLHCTKLVDFDCAIIEMGQIFLLNHVQYLVRERNVIYKQI